LPKDTISELTGLSPEWVLKSKITNLPKNSGVIETLKKIWRRFVVFEQNAPLLPTNDVTESKAGLL